MGMFDYVKVSGESFRCSEGHDLTGEEFQTKDLQCIMGTARVEEDGAFRFEYGGWGPDDFPENFTGKVEIYCSCPECPAFVQAGTLNLCDRSVEFVVHVMAGGVEKVARRGGTLAEWVTSEQSQPWMTGALGPIPREEAYAIHCRHVPIPEQLAESVRLREAEWAKRDAERRAEEAAPEVALKARIAELEATESKFSRLMHEVMDERDNLKARVAELEAKLVAQRTAAKESHREACALVAQDAGALTDIAAAIRARGGR